MTAQSERLARVEEKVDNLSDDIKSVNEEMKAIHTEVQGLVDKLDKRYASKLSEKIVYAMCGLALTAVLMVAVINPFKSRNTPIQTVTVTTQNPDGTTTTKVVPVDTNKQSSTSNPSSALPGQNGQTVSQAPQAGTTTPSTTTTTPPPSEQSPSNDGVITSIAKNIPIIGQLF